MLAFLRSARHSLWLCSSKSPSLAAKSPVRSHSPSAATRPALFCDDAHTLQVPLEGLVTDQCCRSAVPTGRCSARASLGAADARANCMAGGRAGSAELRRGPAVRANGRE